MSIDFTAGRARFFNPAGVATFDSNERHMLLPTFIRTSFTISAVDAFNSGPRVFDQVKNLGSCHPRAKFVTGFQLMGNRMRPIGGDHFDMMAAEYVRTDAYQTSPTGVYKFSTAIWHRFEIASGVLRVRIFYRFPGGSERPFNGATVQVWAYCGTFDY